MNTILWALGGTGFTFLMTVLGSAVVLFFKKEASATIQRIFLGFAAGIMIAASVWSLLIPAIEEADAQGYPGWIPAAGGFLLGVGFLLLLDVIMPHLHPGSNQPEGMTSSMRRDGFGCNAAQYSRGNGSWTCFCSGGAAWGRSFCINGGTCFSYRDWDSKFPRRGSRIVTHASGGLES